MTIRENADIVLIIIWLAKLHINLYAFARNLKKVAKNELSLELADIGSRIKTIRQHKGISVEVAATAIKSREDYIVAIENGDINFLPPVYAKYFIKSYLAYLKIDDKDITDSYNIAFKALKVEPAPNLAAGGAGKSQILSNPQEIFTKKKKNYFSDLTFLNYLVAFLITLIGLTVFYFLFFYKSDDSSKVESKPEAAKVKVDTSAKNAEKPKAAAVTIGDSLEITIKSRETSWLKLLADGKPLDELTLQPGQQKTWRAKKAITLTVGNAGGIDIWRNGQPLNALGSKGSVLKGVVITRDSVIYPTAKPAAEQTTNQPIKTDINQSKKIDKQQPNPKKFNKKSNNKNKQPEKPPIRIIEPTNIEQNNPFKKEPK